MIRRASFTLFSVLLVACSGSQKTAPASDQGQAPPEEVKDSAPGRTEAERQAEASPSSEVPVAALVGKGWGTGGPASSEDKAAVQRHIDAFFADPIAALEDQEHGSQIIDFAAGNSDVSVVIDARVARVMRDAGDPYAGLLVLGYISASIAAQLENGKATATPVAGARGMLRVYAAIRQSAPGFQVAILDELAAHEVAGDLEEFVAGQEISP